MDDLDNFFSEETEPKELRDFWMFFRKKISNNTWESNNSITKFIKKIRKGGKKVLEEIEEIYTRGELDDMDEKEKISIYKEIIQNTVETILGDFRYGESKIVNKIFLTGFNEEQFIKASEKDWIYFLINALRYQKIANQTDKTKLTANRSKSILKKFIETYSNSLELFKNDQGYEFISKYFFKGNMGSAFKAVSAILDEDSFKELGWQYFPGTLSKYRELKEIVKEETFITEFKGMDGYERFTEKHWSSDNMGSAFKAVSAILDEDSFKELGWQQFQGTLPKYRELKKN